MLKSNPILSLFVLILGSILAGCSDSNVDTFDPIEAGMSIRVTGPDGRRILYSIDEVELRDNGASERNLYGDQRVSGRDGFSHKLDETKSGYEIAVYVPFTDEETGTGEGR